MFICNYKPGIGGISGQVEALQKHLQQDGYVADIFSCRLPFFQKIRICPKLRRVAKDYDVLHIHCCSNWGFLPAIVGISIGKELGKRVIMTYHGGGAEVFFKKHTGLVRNWLSRTDVNIVLSGFLGKIFDKYNIPYTVIPNIVELDASVYRERTVLKPNFICIRSHEPLYDIPCILKAFQRVQIQLPNAALTLVGDGSQHTTLIKQVHDMRLKNVTFTGRVDNSAIYTYLDKADIMLSSPTIDNMPVSLLEAMNAGLLVISTNVGGVPYVVADERTGLLFKVGEEVELSEKMLCAIENQESSLDMVHKAKDEVANYSWDSIKNQLLHLYE